MLESHNYHMLLVRLQKLIGRGGGGVTSTALQRYSIKREFQKNLIKIYRETNLSTFFNNTYNLVKYKMRRCFTVNFAKLLETSIWQNTSWGILLGLYKKQWRVCGKIWKHFRSDFNQIPKSKHEYFYCISKIYSCCTQKNSEEQVLPLAIQCST